MSNLGLGGLISGMNTDDIIKKIMSIESAQIDQQKQRVSDLQAKQDAWTKVHDTLATLRSKLDGIRFSGVYRGRTASLTDSTIAGVTTSSGTTIGSHHLVVSTLARAETVVSAQQNSETAALASLASGTITIGTKDISVGPTDTLDTLRDKVNAAGAGVTADVMKVITTDGSGATVTKYQLTLTSQHTGTPGITLSDSSGTNTLLTTLGLKSNTVVGSLQSSSSTELNLAGTLTINGTNITVASGDTLDSIANNINLASAGVTASVTTYNTTDSNGNPVTKYQLQLVSPAGTAATLSDSTGSNLLATLGLNENNGLIIDSSTVPPTKATAQNATFNLDGQAYSTASNSVAGVISGLTLNLQKAGATDINVVQDTSQAVTAIKDWVAALNDSLSLLSDLTKYDSTTKASGILNGDSLARSVQTSLRNVLSTKVFGSGASISNLGDVGVTSGAYGSDDYGKVLLDETKLKAALASDETAVGQLFGGIHPTTLAPYTPLAAQWSNAGPGSLVMNLSQPTGIDQIQMVTPDGAGTTGIKGFTVQYQDTSDVWKTLQTVTAYTGTTRIISFNPVTAKAVKIDVTATYADPALINQLNIYTTNPGAAVQMYRFVNGTLASSTGVLDQRNTYYNDQIKGLNDKIASMTQKMSDHEQQIRDQFNRMETALQQLQQQGMQLSAMLGQTSSK